MSFTQLSEVTLSTARKLSVAVGAAFYSHHDELDARCYPDTRMDLLRDIHDWA